MSKPRLIISVDQVALLRGSRGGSEPDPVHFALQAEMAGASGIRAHLRINRKLITEDDVHFLNHRVKTHFYLQASPHQDILHLVNGIRPQNLVLATERRDEQGIDTGLDATLLANELKGVIHNIDQRQTRVFLFLEPELDQIKTAAKLRADGLIINVRDYILDTRSVSDSEKLQRISDAIRLSSKLGLETHLAGGVTAEHLPAIASLSRISAIHLGHQLVARALLTGVEQAVRSYRELL